MLIPLHNRGLVFLFYMCGSMVILNVACSITIGLAVVLGALTFGFP